jgi:hypothetical protein
MPPTRPSIDGRSSRSRDLLLPPAYPLHQITDYFRRIGRRARGQERRRSSRIFQADSSSSNFTTSTPLSTYRAAAPVGTSRSCSASIRRKSSQVDDRKVFGLIVQPDMMPGTVVAPRMPHDSSMGSAHRQRDRVFARDLSQARELAGHRRDELRDRRDRCNFRIYQSARSIPKRRGRPKL